MENTKRIDKKLEELVYRASPHSSIVYDYRGRLDKNGGHNCSEASKAKRLCDGYHYYNFKDVPFAFWAKKEIEYLSYTSIIKGYQDGTFKPNNIVNRSQFSTFLARVIDPIFRANN